MMPKVEAMMKKFFISNDIKVPKKAVKVFVRALVMYDTILNAVVFLITNLKIIFIMKKLFGTAKNAFTSHVVSPLEGYLIIKAQYNVISVKKRYISELSYNFFQTHSNSNKPWFCWSCNLENSAFAFLNSAEILKLFDSNQKSKNKKSKEDIPFCFVCKKQNKHI